MSETITKKVICEKCSADIRDGTTFCYNCGAEVAKVPPPDNLDVDKSAQNIALETPVAEVAAESAKSDESDSAKLAKAADERKKSRVGLRKTKEYTWEPVDDSRLTILATLLIVLMALVVVSLMVFWK